MNPNESTDKLNQTSIKSFSFEAAYVPQLTEFPSSAGEWINYGDNNDYPDYINSLSNRSPRHSAILKTKANMIGGEGFMKGNLSPQTISFLKNVANEFDLDEILARCAYDFEQYGAFALNPVWSRDRTTIAEINYINPSKLRIAKPIKNHKYPDLENYFICDNWQNVHSNKPIFYPGFSTIDRSEANTILYVKQGQDSIDWYGKPTWISAINYCELDYELSMYHLTNVKNGFSANTIINFNSFPPEEEQDAIVRNSRKQYEGVKGSKTLFTFSDGKENAPTITTINPSSGENTFKDLNDMIEANIFQAHQINNPALFGVLQPGKLANTNDLIESLSIFQTMYVNHKQKTIEKVFNRLARINGIQDKILIEKYNLNLEVIVDIKDILLVLQSTVTNEQKVQVLEAAGYTRDQAILLCPPNSPTPPQPEKLPTSEIKP